MTPSAFAKRPDKKTGFDSLIGTANDLADVLVKDIPNSSTRGEYRIVAGKTLMIAGAGTFGYVASFATVGLTGGSALIVGAIIGATGLALDYATDVIDNQLQEAHSVAAANRATVEMMMDATTLITDTMRFTSELDMDFGDIGFPELDTNLDVEWGKTPDPKPFTLDPDGELQLKINIAPIEAPKAAKEPMGREAGGGMWDTFLDFLGWDE
ncbi:hypothetical protein AB6D53_01910 [Vibrio splendidus]